MFRGWTLWRWAALLALLIAIVVAMSFGAGRALWSLILLLAALLASGWTHAIFRRASTPTRLWLAVGGLIVFWWVFFSGLLPAVPELAGALPRAEWLPQLATVMEPLVKMDAQRQLYLSLAVSVPLLFFIFGVGPFSQHGSEPAPPTAAALGGTDSREG